MDSDSQGVKFIMRDGMGVRKDSSRAKKKRQIAAQHERTAQECACVVKSG